MKYPAVNQGNISQPFVSQVLQKHFPQHEDLRDLFVKYAHTLFTNQHTKIKPHCEPFFYEEFTKKSKTGYSVLNKNPLKLAI